MDALQSCEGQGDVEGEDRRDGRCPNEDELQKGVVLVTRRQ